DAVVQLAVAAAAAAGGVVGEERHAGERGVGLDPHVVGAGRGRGEGTALRVAALVRAAVVGAVGRRAAVLDVQVGVAAAAGDADHQVAGARRDRDRVVDVVAGAGRLVGHRHALGQRAAGAAAATAAVAADVHGGGRRGDRRPPVAPAGGRRFHAAGRVVVVGAGAPVQAVGAG